MDAVVGGALVASLLAAVFFVLSFFKVRNLRRKHARETVLDMMAKGRPTIV